MRPSHVVITAGNQAFSGTMLPRPETFQRIQKVSDELGLGTKVWRTDRDDKEPVLKPVGTETGDDTVVVTTDGRNVTVRYAGDAPLPPPNQCQAITGAGTQCKRKPKEGSRYCWQHAGD